MVSQFQHIGGRCPVGAWDDEKGAGDDGWPIRSAMTAKGAGDDEMSMMVTRKTANTLMLIPIGIMFALDVMLLVHVWLTPEAEQRVWVFISACLGIAGCAWLTRLVWKERSRCRGIRMPSYKAPPEL